MNPCVEWREAVIDCALGEPPGAALEVHLAACPVCSMALAAWRKRVAELDATLQDLTAVEPGPHMPARILAGIEGRSSRPFYWRLIPAAALAVIACVVVSLYSPVRPRRPGPATAMALSAWRSPTRSLLRSSADPLLKGVPRFGEGFLEMKSKGVRNVQ
jgi:anti-sigma factor RsiW